MSAWQSFRATRWLRTANLVLQAVLLLTFFAGLNYVAQNHPRRFDLTRARKFSLSPETLSYVRNLPRPVHAILTFSPESDHPEVRGLLEEYVHATEERAAGRITREYLDVYQYGDDVATQLGWMISPESYVSLIKPRQKRLIEAIEIATANAKIAAQVNEQTRLLEEIRIGETDLSRLGREPAVRRRVSGLGVVQLADPLVVEVR